MRIAVLSDLHVEFAGFEPEAPLSAADIIVLAGDIHNEDEALHWARGRFPHQRIVQIAGNHEFFGGCWQHTLDRMRLTAQQLQIDFLENDSVVIDGVRFLGATLWTDFELFTVPGRPLAMDAKAAQALMARRMIDFAAVTWQPSTADTPRTLLPEDTVRLHQQTRRWLSDRLETAFDGPTVVVSHHLPSWRSVAPAFLRAASNAAFASDLDALVERATLWVHGHTHSSFDYRVGAARVVANPRGYPVYRDGVATGDWENPDFNPALLIEVGEDAESGAR